MIADYTQGQSLVETLLDNGIGHVALTDWKSASEDMKDFDIDNYLAELIVAIDDLGGRVNLVGLSQGGWQSAMAAARFPEKVNTLVLAGAPIDTDAGDGAQQGRRPTRRRSNSKPSGRTRLRYRSRRRPAGSCDEDMRRRYLRDLRPGLLPPPISLSAIADLCIESSALSCSLTNSIDNRRWFASIACWVSATLAIRSS